MSQEERRPQFRLFYLKGRGCAEVIRFIFAYAGCSFEDCRLNFEQWKAIKAGDASLHLPLLEVNGTDMYTGAIPIASFLAQQFGLCGESAEESGRAEEVVEGVRHLQSNLTAMLRATFSKDDYRKKMEWELFRRRHLTQFLDKYTHLAHGGRHGWLVGRKVTWADLAVAEMMTRLEECYDGLALREYPELKAHAERVEKLPRLKAWIDQRPHSIF